MRRSGLLAIAIALGVLTSESFAEPPARGEKPVRGQQGVDGQRGPKAGQARPGAEARDPQKMVAMLMKRFDTDGDEKLDVTELTALLTSMRERAGGQAMGRRGGLGAGQGPEAGKRPEAGQGAGERKRPGLERPGFERRGGQRRPGGENAEPGGERPRRPEAAKE